MNNLRFTENLKSAVTGNTVERYGFDAWGRRRNPQTLSYDNVTTSFDRGYTMHEHYDALGLINMNGRVYDPQMSSFLSPDNFIQCPDNSQNFNRYAYCVYNPLKYIKAKPRCALHLCVIFAAPTKSKIACGKLHILSDSNESQRNCVI